MRQGAYVGTPLEEAPWPSGFGPPGALLDILHVRTLSSQTYHWSAWCLQAAMY